MFGIGQRSSCNSCRMFLLGTTAITLTACSGGGGRNSDDNPGAGNAGFFQTQEFQNSDALQQINAAEGYALISGEVGGDGVRVAIIDDGIDASHFDLDDNIVANLLFPGQTPADFPGDTPNGHGTAVGGVIAAERNGQGIHGVAFDAQLVSIDALSFDPGSTTSFEILTDQFVNIASGIRIASGLTGVADVDAEADIINMSLGLSIDAISGDDELTDAVIDVGLAMQQAADEDKILVVSLGNDGSAFPSFPAAFVGTGSVAGLGIAVGSIDASNNQSGFSNDCGSVAEFCMVAPGENVDTTDVDDGFRRASGTSFSAPLVAGSAAVIKGAFPGVSNREVVNRLLTTAEDLGTPGVDTVFGHGALDLEAALTPVGQLSVSLTNSVNGEEVGFSSSQISLNSGLALNGDAGALLESAMALDEQNFPFAVDLSESIDQRDRTTGLEGFIGADRNLTSIQTTDKSSVALSFDEDQATIDPYRAEFAESDTSLHEETDEPRLQFQSQASDKINVFMSFNETSTTDLGLGRALYNDQGMFFQQSAFFSPYDILAGLQSGGGAAYKFSERTKVSVSGFTATNEESATEINMQKMELLHQTFGAIELRFGYGLLQEEGGFLGSSTTGAFGTNTATDTQYFSASFLAPITDKFSLFGSYSQGHSSTSASTASLLNDFSTTKAEAFGAGFVMRDIVEVGDGFSFLVGQPLRVKAGTADITVPIGRTEDGEVLTDSAEVDLAPEAREITTEAVYRFALGDENQSLSTGAFARFNPDHDSDASPDIGIGLKYRLKF